MIAVLCTVETDYSPVLDVITTTAHNSAEECLKELYEILIDDMRDPESFVDYVLSRMYRDHIEAFLEQFPPDDYSSVTKAQLKAIDLTEQDIREIIHELFRRDHKYKLKIVQI